MNSMYPSVGLWMLLALAVCILNTGLPVWALLLGISSAFALLGLALGQIELNLLTAIPSRIVGLLEHDLLQALPLYVLVGMLLQHLKVGDALFQTLARVFRFTGTPQTLAGLGVGALIAPMNGSVASSASLLGRLMLPQLKQEKGFIDTDNNAKNIALVSAAATIGVVVPPSLVLLLLGDAMLRAHTEASNLAGFKLNPLLNGGRIVNTQDVFHAALLPAAAVLVLWFLVAWWQNRATPATFKTQIIQWPTWPLTQTITAVLSMAAILVLLLGVFTGALFAVEAAAAACCTLMVLALVSPNFKADDWRSVLSDTLSLSGALLALLLGASVFSLILRAWGTDAWMTQLVLNSTLSPLALALLILGGVMLCAWVLDAFEMIFVIIPIIAPVLIAKLGDAQQASVLLLMVLQLSFLLPPMGYAVMMARNQVAQLQSGRLVTTRSIVAMLLPYLIAQIAVMIVVFAVPQWVHKLDAPVSAAANESEAELVQRMDDMAK